jgi:hypothetical protein
MMAATDPIADTMPEPEDDAPPGASASETSDDQAAPHRAEGCPVTWCPICITVGAVQPVAPDVMEHLLKAGTELFLAFRAVVDARADEATGAPPAGTSATTLEKIDLG